jgi:hypothetical protein
MKYTKDVLQQAVSKSKSYSQLIQILGIKAASGGSHSHLKSKVTEYGIDTSHFKKWYSCSPARNKLKPEEILCVVTGNRRRKPYQLRRALLESGVEFICNVCGTGTIWNKKQLTFEVDHIDGNWRDCRIENLQFICPNCHSQKDLERTLNLCACGVRIRPKSKKCKHCNCLSNFLKAQKTQKYIGNWPNNEVLKKRIWEMPATKLALEIGVSSSAIKKRCKRFGITTPPRGYWAKMSKNYGGVREQVNPAVCGTVN